ncbi:acetyl-CoA C-acyltransferase [Shewanella corallii]|uniref:Acetyl-CoA C-acyltransferase n=1 Tax=Shewanella corallii TaxID=560080 RepID=A0ABT0NBZ5_9GAMM|nr:acetyl-CoA C-acyltransferase [Shewanella corallii]MCL2916002.1 acetyl-CoA C-acyltransferase [Shewanella corallii]
MTQAVIVSAARTALTKSFRGSFNDTEAPVLGGAVVKAVVERAGIDPASVEDVIMGAAVQQGTQGYNIGRLCAYTGGLPTSVPGMAVDRMCASGLMTIGIAAKNIIAGEMKVAIAGGVESLSLTQTKHKNAYRARSEAVQAVVPDAYIQMIETAEIVAERYNISREAQDLYALQSQQRTAAAQQAGLFDDEIIPVTANKLTFDADRKPAGHIQVTADKDECNRADTPMESLQALKAVWKDGTHIQEGKHVTAGNASQFSDGAAATLLMSDDEAERLGLTPLGIYKGIAVAGCGPEEMGIGPVFAIPKLLNQFDLTVDDIGLWEINEAFASQVLYCRDKLEIPNDRLNVNGGAISIGHPFGMSGTRMVAHGLMEAKRRGVKYLVVAMCIGGGMGAAGLFEVAQ